MHGSRKKILEGRKSGFMVQTNRSASFSGSYAEFNFIPFISAQRLEFFALKKFTDIFINKFSMKEKIIDVKFSSMEI